MLLGEFIKQYRNEHSLSMDKFATLSGLTKGYISMLEKNEHPKSKKPIIPTFDTIEKVAKGMNISADELVKNLDDDQDIQINVKPEHWLTSEHSDIQSIYNELHPPRQEKVLNYANKELKEQKAESVIEEPVELYEVLTTTKLAAGLGYAFNDYDTEIVYVDKKPPKHDLASFVYGDSMEPKYHSGDIVYLIDKGLSSYSGEVCAVTVGDKTYLKKVYTEKGQLRLVSINPKYDDIIIDFPPAEDTHIRIFSVVGTDSTVEI